jgi:hypothetical protein
MAAPDISRSVQMKIEPVMKPYIDSGGIEDGINAVMLYPAERVDEIFQRMKAAWGKENEAGELRIFYLRMRRMYQDFSMPMNTWLDVEGMDEARKDRWFGIGEALEDEEFLESIEARV